MSWCNPGLSTGAWNYGKCSENGRHGKGSKIITKDQPDDTMNESGEGSHGQLEVFNGDRL